MPALEAFSHELAGLEAWAIRWAADPAACRRGIVAAQREVRALREAVLPAPELTARIAALRQAIPLAGVPVSVLISVRGGEA